MLSTNLPNGGLSQPLGRETPALSCSVPATTLTTALHHREDQRQDRSDSRVISDPRQRCDGVSNAVYGKDGVSRTDSVDVTFTGNAETIEIDEASASILNFGTGDSDSPTETTLDADGKGVETNDDRDKLTLSVSAADKSGNAADLPTRFTEKVLDPDGKPAANISATYARDADDHTKGSITLDVDADVKKPLDIGDYTVELKSGKLEAVQSFIVCR